MIDIDFRVGFSVFRMDFCKTHRVFVSRCGTMEGTIAWYFLVVSVDVILFKNQHEIVS